MTYSVTHMLSINISGDEIVQNLKMKIQLTQLTMKKNLSISSSIIYHSLYVTNITSISLSVNDYAEVLNPVGNLTDNPYFRFFNQGM